MIPVCSPRRFQTHRHQVSLRLRRLRFLVLVRYHHHPVMRLCKPLWPTYQVAHLRSLYSLATEVFRFRVTFHQSAAVPIRLSDSLSQIVHPVSEARPTFSLSRFIFRLSNLHKCHFRCLYRLQVRQLRHHHLHHHFLWTPHLRRHPLS